MYSYVIMEITHLAISISSIDFRSPQNLQVKSFPLSLQNSLTYSIDVKGSLLLTGDSMPASDENDRLIGYHHL